MKKIKLIISLVIVIGVILSGCNDKIKPGTTNSDNTKTIKAKINTAEKTIKPFLYESSGSVESKTASRISSKLMGVVNEVYVREGDKFKKGDLLVRLDDRQVTAGAKQAESSVNQAKKGYLSSMAFLKSAKARMQLAVTTYDRYKKLLAEDSVSAQEFDEIEAKYKQAKANLARAQSMVEVAKSRKHQTEAALDSALVRKKDSLIRAPYKGRITKKMIEAGDLASPGTPLFEVETQEIFQGVFFLPENLIYNIKKGEKILVKIPSHKQERIFGVIERIDPSADPRTRTFTVKVDLKGYKNFSSGVFARAFFPVAQKEMIIVPESAIIHQGQLTGIYLVDSSNKAHFRLVRTGKAVESDFVEIVSGLNIGDRYVENISPNLEDGCIVEDAS